MCTNTNQDFQETENNCQRLDQAASEQTPVAKTNILSLNSKHLNFTTHLLEILHRVCCPVPIFSSSKGFHNVLCAVPRVRHQIERLSVQQTLTYHLLTEQKRLFQAHIHQHSFARISTTVTPRIQGSDSTHKKFKCYKIITC